MRIEKFIFLLTTVLMTASCNAQNKVQTTEDVLKENNVSRTEKFESKEGGFKVDFPCEPMKSAKPIDSDYGNKTISFYECGNEIASFSLSIQDFTKKIGDPKKVFEDQKQMRIMGMDDSAKIVLETEKTVSGLPAVYFETELYTGAMIPRSGLVSELHLLKKQRYYSITTTVLAKDGQSPKEISQEVRDKTKQFIDSFELVENK